MGSCDIVLEMHQTSDLRKRSASIAPWQHHDPPDGHRVGEARAPYEAIFGGRRSSDPCAFLRSRGE
jgi:hypothetical protein